MHTRSLVRSVIALLVVASSIPLAFIFFVWLSEAESFSLINAIAIFFNLGIGVDHIFVFTDAWNQSRHTPLAEQVKY